MLKRTTSRTVFNFTADFVYYTVLTVLSTVVFDLCFPLAYYSNYLYWLIRTLREGDSMSLESSFRALSDYPHACRGDRNLFQNETRTPMTTTTYYNKNQVMNHLAVYSQLSRNAFPFGQHWRPNHHLKGACLTGNIGN